MATTTFPSLAEPPTRPVAHAPGLLLEGISKAFPGVKALDAVGFDVCAGEVHALVGENGAGKSTLLKILSGFYAADAGRLTVEGEPVDLAVRRISGRPGIAVVHQELNLTRWLTVAQNIFLGREHLVGRGILSMRRLNEMARAELEALEVAIDPRRLVADLGVAEQQMVEIARALGEHARYVLMDEPTASLSERESAVLFDRIAKLRTDGVGLVYVSHRLEEVAALADRVTVLRDGRVAASEPMADLTVAEIIRHMVGRPMASHYPARTPFPAEEALRVAPPDGRPRSRPLTVRRGEVVGIAGLVGSGRTEWAWRLVGASASIGETVTLAGRPVSIRSPAEARAVGIGMVPESRKEHGLVLDLSVAENMTMTVTDRLVSRLGLVDRGRRREICRRYVDRLRIRTPSIDTPCRTLSGGNQQKIVLAKWLARECDVIVLDEPTRGIDVGAKYEMYTLVNELSAAGKAVVMISSDLPEVLAMSDRLLVMHDGDFVAEMPTADATAEAVLHFASGYFESAA